MRSQVITRVVDALATQDRVILWLACKHTKTLSARELQTWPAQAITHLNVGEYADCTFCPDPPPPEKSAHQLWKEAGEP